MKTTPLISFEEIPPITDQQKARVAAQVGRLIPTHEQHELLMMLGIVDTPRRADT